MDRLRASEIGNYCYCARAWWFRSIAKPGHNTQHSRLTRGIRQHYLHGCLVRGSMLLLATALLLLAVAIVLSFSQLGFIPFLSPLRADAMGVVDTAADAMPPTFSSPFPTLPMSIDNESMMIPLVLAAGSILLLWGAIALRRRTGLPWGRIVASDMGYGTHIERPLVAPRYGLVGKPDYVLRQRGRLIPVEVKPTRRATKPYTSDIMQLAAYCLLVEETYRPPPYGLLRYASDTFHIDYTPALRQQLLTLMDEIRAAKKRGECHRSHSNPRRCQHCQFFDRCDDAIR